MFQPDSLFWVPSRDTFEEVFELGAWRNAFKDVPKRLAVGGTESFKVGVLLVSFPKGGASHDHHEQGRCCRKEVGFHRIIEWHGLLLGRSQRIRLCNTTVRFLFYFWFDWNVCVNLLRHYLWRVIVLRTNHPTPLHKSMIMVPCTLANKRSIIFYVSCLAALVLQLNRETKISDDKSAFFVKK